MRQIPRPRPKGYGCNGSHMPNRPCLCGCNACNGPIPLWPPPLRLLPAQSPQSSPTKLDQNRSTASRTPNLPNFAKLRHLTTPRRTEVTNVTKRHQTSPIDTTTGNDLKLW